MPLASTSGHAASSTATAVEWMVDVPAVGSGRVCERVARLKSSNRNLSVTVRPTRPGAPHPARDPIDESPQHDVDLVA